MVLREDRHPTASPAWGWAGEQAGIFAPVAANTHPGANRVMGQWPPTTGHGVGTLVPSAAHRQRGRRVTGQDARPPRTD